MLFLPKILACFFFKICSQFFYRLLQLHQLLSQTKLLTTGGSSLPCFGACSLPLRFSSRCFSWSFQLAPVSTPILGSNFLCHRALLVDVARARVLDADSLDVLSSVSSSAASDPFCAHLFTAGSQRNLEAPLGVPRRPLFQRFFGL